MDYSLIIPAFIAGLITFFAPCTFPLVPSFIGFISGASRSKLSILFNSLLFILGFSSVFILLGTAFGWGGIVLAQYRIWLARIGGLIIIFFGLSLLKIFDLSYLKFINSERRLNLARYLKPGRPLSSLLFGATFAFGWSPCIGPILGTILLLASTSKTVVAGGFLLLVFSFGLAIPFLVLAVSLDYFIRYLPKIRRILPIFSTFGGIMLVIIGFFLLSNKFNFWITYFYNVFSFLNYRGLLYYL